MKAKYITLGLSLTFCFSSVAQSTAQEGLSKLKANLENSKANLDDYKKNLGIVDDNLKEIAKARLQVDEQKNQTNQAMTENNQKIQALEKTENDLTQLIQNEQKQLTAEELKIQELNKLITQLKDTQALRNKNIAHYNDQKAQVSREKGEWKTRGEQIQKNIQQVDARLQALSSKESEWRNKQRGYQGEVSRWQKEVDRQKKLGENYSSLAETKD